ncbi:MAG: hypothetical protein ABI330_09490, partial [Caldimonas sp.]
SGEATFDANAAEPISNKVFVHLRAATLAYVASARSGQHEPDHTVKPRAAASTELEKGAQHIAAIQSLEGESAGRVGTSVSSPDPIKRTVAAPLRKLVAEWTTPSRDS